MEINFNFKLFSTIWFSHMILSPSFFLFCGLLHVAAMDFVIVWRLLSPTFCMLLASSYFLPHQPYLHVTSVVILKKNYTTIPWIIKSVFIHNNLYTLYSDRRVIWAYFCYHESLAIWVIFQERSNRTRFGTVNLGIAA